jgi:hypothetical protein
MFAQRLVATSQIFQRTPACLRAGASIGFVLDLFLRLG